MIVRSPLSPDSVAATLRDTVAKLDPSIPSHDADAPEARCDPHRHAAFRCPAAGRLRWSGAALGGIGIYGVIAFLVGQRTREVGVRMALGATPADVTRLFLRHAAGWTLAGIAVGLAGSLAVTRLLSACCFR
ncbi:MAG: FtsX-like permease family protein [Ignavibacteriota bacterium]